MGADAARSGYRATVVGVIAIVLLLIAAPGRAQDLEPRAFSNTPVGLNFLVVGYGYSRGDVGFDASSPLEDAELTVHAAVLAYARSLDLWGRPGKFDIVVPYAWASGRAAFRGEVSEREVSGPGDPRFRLSVLLYGARALSLEEFRDYTPDLIVGASLAVTAPLGQYDPDKLVNIGTNRWSVKPELGISKALGPLTVELAGSVTFYTANDDFFGGHRLERDPLYAIQSHLIYQTRLGIWMALDATYYLGGNSVIDGKKAERQEALRLGLTASIPVSRHNSVKLYGSTGAISRVGGDFDTVGVAWQFRWGGGL